MQGQCTKLVALNQRQQRELESVQKENAEIKQKYTERSKCVAYHLERRTYVAVASQQQHSCCQAAVKTMRIASAALLAATVLQAETEAGGDVRGAAAEL